MSDQDETLAAIDLGSNSFHLVIGKMINDQLQLQDSYKEMVRLAGGLDKRQRLKPSAQKQALECLERLGQRVSEIPEGNIRIIGTNTLRKAKNAAEFIVKAEQALGHKIEIVSGMEEARLIYLGVAHSFPTGQGNRLVVDIGGGSTEVIVGKDFEPLSRESLHMGCVSMTQRFFGDGKITEEAWEQAIMFAKLELLPITNPFQQIGWKTSIGASGTLKAVASVMESMKWAAPGKITAKGMKKLVAALHQSGDVKKLKLEGLSEERAPVFVGGVAIIAALFEAMDVKEMQPSQTALREGVLYDLSGRLHHQDVRGRTIDHLFRRFHVDSTQAERAMRLLIKLVETGEETLKLTEFQAALLLWAAELHEIGLAVAHSHYQKHGAYLIEHADLPGFSRSEQHLLSVLIRLQRRKIQTRYLEELSKKDRKVLIKLLVLLRLALVLHRDRASGVIDVDSVYWDENCLTVRFPIGWLSDHPLTLADLRQEAEYLRDADLRLEFS